VILHLASSFRYLFATASHSLLIDVTSRLTAFSLLSTPTSDHSWHYMYHSLTDLIAMMMMMMMMVTSIMATPRAEAVSRPSAQYITT